MIEIVGRICSFSHVGNFVINSRIWISKDREPSPCLPMHGWWGCEVFMLRFGWCCRCLRCQSWTFVWRCEKNGCHESALHTRTYACRCFWYLVYEMSIYFGIWDGHSCRGTLLFRDLSTTSTHRAKMCLRFEIIKIIWLTLFLSLFFADSSLSFFLLLLNIGANIDDDKWMDSNVVGGISLPGHPRLCRRPFAVIKSSSRRLKRKLIEWRLKSKLLFARSDRAFKWMVLSIPLLCNCGSVCATDLFSTTESTLVAAFGTDEHDNRFEVIETMPVSF